MKVLVACEFSGTVRDAFIAKGHDAISCDLLPTEKPGPHLIMDNDMHLKDTVYKKHWDLLIAHPPCTYLSYAATKYWNRPGRSEMREQAAIFFMMLYNSPVKKVCIENPVGYMNTIFRKPNQIIHPYFFGESQNKRTCLWLKGLPRLNGLEEVALNQDNHRPKPVYIDKSGKKRYFTDSIGGYHGEGNSFKKRSVSFKSIAQAMADQWSFETHKT